MIRTTSSRSVIALALAGAMTVLAPVGAFAADAAMAAMFGNTLVVKAPDGTESKVMYKDDGTFTGVGADGAKSAGTWALKDGKLCLNVLEPPPPADMPQPACGPAPTVHKVGDSWQYTADDGKVYGLSLVAGQQ